MEIHKNHYIELYVDKQQVELKSQDSLGLRINNVLFDPTKVVTTTGEYSYSFKIPATPNNNKIFGHANVLSKTNKFQARYNAQVYVDGNIIFDGSLTVRKFNAKDKEYECNLVNFKINTLDEIFGEAKLTDVKWMVDFSGGTTIQSVNQDPTSKYWFPLISYGAFQKRGTIPADWPSGEVCPPEDMQYTVKSMIDNSNIETLDTFWPSLNVLEQVKKCFEYKGYTVGGNAYNDPILTNVYSSTNIASEQNPTWNVGLDKFGKCNVRVQYSDSATTYYSEGYNQQDLKFPYYYVGGESGGKFNFSEIFYKNILPNSSYKVKGNQNVTYDKYQRMYHAEDGYIQIPADGYYKVSLSGSVRLLQSVAIKGVQWVREPDDNICSRFKDTVKEYTSNGGVGITANPFTNMPIEVQLVKNYDNNIELIKGKYNQDYLTGFIVQSTILCGGGGQTPIILSNAPMRVSAYPHEALGVFNNDRVNDYSLFKLSDYSQIGDTTWNKAPNYGYIPNDKFIAYDPVVNENFICGISTMGTANGLGGQVSFIKNGKSWSKMYTGKQGAMYNATYRNIISAGMSGESVTQETEYGSNVLTNASANTYDYNSSLQRGIGCVSGIVYLKKDDILQLMMIKRGYWDANGNMSSYNVSCDLKLSIEAASPKEFSALQFENYSWTSPNEFPEKLNLMNFTNRETKIVDWLNNIKTAFNLSYDFQGNSVDINTNIGTDKGIITAIDIDDRVSSDEAESEYINYPRSMSVKYKIDTDERGFYESVPDDYINNSDWKEHGDSGFTTVILNSDTYETSTQDKSLQFSYTWYKPFTYSGYCTVDSEGASQFVLGSGTTLIPVISKDEYMIDGFEDYESMKHRGYQLPQRFWFRTFEPLKDSNNNNQQAQLEDDWDGNVHHIMTFFDVGYYYPIDIYAPSNVYHGINLSYKDTEKSLLTQYFNIYPELSSNYVTIETYLTSEEYAALKGGTMIHFDSDLYLTAEINGYDPTGNNKSKLKLMKKT